MIKIKHRNSKIRPLLWLQTMPPEEKLCHRVRQLQLPNQLETMLRR